jgi:ABC-type methionine transport system ATPase subunit
MSARSLRLNYPPSLLNQPILNQLIRKFEITVNIRQAQITLEEGWLEIEVIGGLQEIELAIAWLDEQGIQVVELS